MTIFRPEEFDVIANQQERIRNLEEGCPPFVTPRSVDFTGGYDHAGPPYAPWGYRVCDGGLDMTGHLRPGTSGAVAYTFQPQFLAFAYGNLTDHREIITGGSTVTLALIEIDISNGQMTITF